MAVLPDSVFLISVVVKNKLFYRKKFKGRK